MTAPHQPQPLYEDARNCAHPEPRPRIIPDTSSAPWFEDHPYGGTGTRRVCILTSAGDYCPDCTTYARQHHSLPAGEYVLAADCAARTVAG